MNAENGTDSDCEQLIECILNCLEASKKRRARKRKSVYTKPNEYEPKRKRYDSQPRDQKPPSTSFCNWLFGPPKETAKKRPDKPQTKNLEPLTNKYGRPMKDGKRPPSYKDDKPITDRFSRPLTDKFDRPIKDGDEPPSHKVDKPGTDKFGRPLTDNYGRPIKDGDRPPSYKGDKPITDEFGRPLTDKYGKPIKDGDRPPSYNGDKPITDEFGRPLTDKYGKPIKDGDRPTSTKDDKPFTDKFGRPIKEGDETPSYKVGRPSADKYGRPIKERDRPPSYKDGKPITDKFGRPLTDKYGRPIKDGDRPPSYKDDKPVTDKFGRPLTDKFGKPIKDMGGPPSYKDDEPTTDKYGRPLKGKSRTPSTRKTDDPPGDKKPLKSRPYGHSNNDIEKQPRTPSGRKVDTNGRPIDAAETPSTDWFGRPTKKRPGKSSDGKTPSDIKGDEGRKPFDKEKSDLPSKSDLTKTPSKNICDWIFGLPPDRNKKKNPSEEPQLIPRLSGKPPEKDLKSLPKSPDKEEDGVSIRSKTPSKDGIPPKYQKGRSMPERKRRPPEQKKSKSSLCDLFSSKPIPSDHLAKPEQSGRRSTPMRDEIPQKDKKDRSLKSIPERKQKHPGQEKSRHPKKEISRQPEREKSRIPEQEKLRYPEKEKSKSTLCDWLFGVPQDRKKEEDTKQKFPLQKPQEIFRPSGKPQEKDLKSPPQSPDKEIDRVSLRSETPMQDAVPPNDKSGRSMPERKQRLPEQEKSKSSLCDWFSAKPKPSGHSAKPEEDGKKEPTGFPKTDGGRIPLDAYPKESVPLKKTSEQPGKKEKGISRTPSDSSIISTTPSKKPEDYEYDNKGINRPRILKTPSKRSLIDRVEPETETDLKNKSFESPNVPKLSPARSFCDWILPKPSKEKGKVKQSTPDKYRKPFKGQQGPEKNSSPTDVRKGDREPPNHEGRPDKKRKRELETKRRPNDKMPRKDDEQTKTEKVPRSPFDKQAPNHPDADKYPKDESVKRKRGDKQTQTGLESKKPISERGKDISGKRLTKERKPLKDRQGIDKPKSKVKPKLVNKFCNLLFGTPKEKEQPDSMSIDESSPESSSPKDLKSRSPREKSTKRKREPDSKSPDVPFKRTRTDIDTPSDIKAHPKKQKSISKNAPSVPNRYEKPLKGRPLRDKFPKDVSQPSLDGYPNVQKSVPPLLDVYGKPLKERRVPQSLTEREPITQKEKPGGQKTNFGNFCDWFFGRPKEKPPIPKDKPVTQDRHGGGEPSTFKSTPMKDSESPKKPFETRPDKRKRSPEPKASGIPIKRTRQFFPEKSDIEKPDVSQKPTGVKQTPKGIQTSTKTPIRPSSPGSFCKWLIGKPKKSPIKSKDALKPVKPIPDRKISEVMKHFPSDNKFEDEDECASFIACVQDCLRKHIKTKRKRK